MQVGFVWQNEEQDRRERDERDIATLQSSLRSSGRSREEGKGMSS